eukprot:3376112-Alexandrium_andersonii.AAC.1
MPCAKNSRKARLGKQALELVACELHAGFPGGLLAVAHLLHFRPGATAVPGQARRSIAEGLVLH